MSSASKVIAIKASDKVGEIFTAAGNAFSKLGELSMQLQLTNEASLAGSGKWSDQEIDMLHRAISQFSNELNSISDTIKSKTITQIKTNLKRKAYEEAGLSPPKPGDEKASPKKAAQQQPGAGVVAVKLNQSPTQAPASAKKQKTAEVTLSALNAFEGDVDIEGLSDQGTVKKLDFDSDVDSSML